VAAGTDQRYLIVRYDDYAPFTLYDGPHAPGLERRLFELFAAHRAEVVVGAIPFPVGTPGAGAGPVHDLVEPSWLARVDDPWVTLLRECIARGVAELALHGFEHRQRALPGLRLGEFHGRPSKWQHEAIRRGRDALAAAIGDLKAITTSQPVYGVTPVYA
jgi:hypothetical protein